MRSTRPDILLLLLAAAASPAVAAEYEVGGHVKPRVTADWYPADSVFRQAIGAGALDAQAELRVNIEGRDGPWSFDAAWQLFAAVGDRNALSVTPTISPFAGGRPDDARRLMDLTDVVEDEGKRLALHRLDRLALGFASEDLVIRAGRQAITWGNGLAFTPMDIVNPFDPTAIDTEYKAGDDMLYGQYLFPNGHDLQAAVVFRRDPATGDIDSRERTSALKYHAVFERAELDLLLAEHYDRTTIGIGGNLNVGGAVLRGDVVVADTAGGTATEVVASVSYSWVWGGRNVSGLVEYFHSDYGLPGGRYDAAAVVADPLLGSRLQRAETFTLGQNYMAAGATVELTPLLLVTPNLFWNLDDDSALLQLVSRFSVSDNAEFLTALNVPLGPSGSEFGGIDAGIPGLYVAVDASLFAQFAYYF